VATYPNLARTGWHRLPLLCDRHLVSKLHQRSSQAREVAAYNLLPRNRWCCEPWLDQIAPATRKPENVHRWPKSAHVPLPLTSQWLPSPDRELAAYDLPHFNAARFRHNAPRRSADEKPGRRRAHRFTYLPASPEGNHTRRPIVRLDAKQRASRRLREARPAARLAWFR